MGLPLFVIRKTLQLRSDGELDADSIYAGLYDWYATKRPYWEAVLLAKKLVLILASDTVLTNPIHQALAGVVTNTAYLILFEAKKPMPFYPSSSNWFEGQNFFHLIERCSSVACVLGSVMALIGAFNQDLSVVVGSLFALINLTYVTLVVVTFARETKGASLSAILPVTTGRVKNPVEEESDWCQRVRLIDEAEGLSQDARGQMIGELAMLRSKTTGEIEKELLTVAKKQGGKIEESIERNDKEIRTMNGDYERLGGAGEPVQQAQVLLRKAQVESHFFKWLAEQGRMVEAHAWVEEELKHSGTTLNKLHAERILRDIGNTGGLELLFERARNGDIAGVAQTLQKVHVDAADFKGRTLLHNAAEEGAY